MAEITSWLEGQSFKDLQAQFGRDGYIVFENVLSGEDLACIQDALAPHLTQDMKGRNDFEGLKTNRVYSLLAKSPVFADLAIHPLTMAFVEAELGQSCLLSSCLAINLHPGETVQPWHYDVAHMDMDRPHPAFGVSAFWAIDDTTEENGATEIIPGSHLWPENDITGGVANGSFQDKHERATEDDPGARDDSVKVTLKAGSLMLAKGTLWHRGGSNRSDKPRMIITPQYCSGWMRQLENMMATMSREEAAKLPKRAQELLGYSIHPPFMGYVDGVHPAKLLA